MKILAFAFALYGVFSIVEKIISSYRLKNTKGELAYFIKMSGHNENAEYVLRKALNKMKWLQGNENKSIILIDEGMDSDTLLICEKFARDNPSVKIIRQGGKDGFRKHTYGRN